MSHPVIEYTALCPLPIKLLMSINEAYLYRLVCMIGNALTPHFKAITLRKFSIDEGERSTFVKTYWLKLTEVSLKFLK